jgi:hypothetical protein
MTNTGLKGFGIGVAALLTLGLGYCYGHDKAVSDKATFEAKINQLEKERDEAVLLGNEREIEAQYGNTVAALAIARADSLNHRLTVVLTESRRVEVVDRQRMVTAGAAVDATVDSVKVVAPALGTKLESQIAEKDAAAQAVLDEKDRQTQALAQTVSAQRTAINAAENARRLWELSSTAKDTVITAHERVNKELADRVNQLSNPGVFEKVRRALPWVAGTAVVTTVVVLGVTSGTFH